MAFNKRSDLVTILDGSFDAGLLLDDRGRLRHANDQAYSLFEMDDGRRRFQVDTQIEFWTFSHGEFVSRDPVPFKDVVQFLARGEHPPEWMCTGYSLDGNNSFVGAVKLTKLAGSDGINYIICYVRSANHQTADGSIDSRKERPSPVLRSFDDTGDPMLAIDENGRILMFNSVAIEKVDWCEADLVGQHISKCLKHAIYDASLDPVMVIDEDGNILQVNEAAADGVDWISNELIGTHLLLDPKVREIDQDAIMHDDGASTAMLSSSDTISTVSHTLFSHLTGRSRRSHSPTPGGRDRERKKSPQVIRIFVDRLDEAESVTRAEATSAISESNYYGKAENIMVAVIEASLDPLFQINEQGIIQMCNRAAVRQFGYSRDTLIGSNISIIVGGGHAEHHDKYLQRYLQTGNTKVIGRKRELMARRSDGSEFPMELGVVEVDTFAGDERLFAGFIHDLSSIKKKERLTTDIVNASLDPLFVISETGSIKETNDAAVKQFGWTKEELLNSSISVIVGGGHAQFHDKYISNYLRTGETKVIGKLRELPARRKDGSEFPIQLGVVEMKTDQDEERMFVGFVHDLTKIKQREDAATGIIEASQDAMFLIDDKGIIETTNQTACDLFGWSKDQFMGSNIKMIVPQTHAAKHDGYLRHFRDTGMMRLVGQRRELTARRITGEEFPIELYVKAIKDPYTKRTKFAGYLRDLSSMKKQMSLTRGMIDACLDPMFQITSKGKIILVNKAAVDIFGYERHELVGSNISMICGGQHGSSHDMYLKRYLETNEARVIGKKRQLPARKKDGREIIIELAVVPVDTGDEIYFCGFARDMSDIIAKQDIADGIIKASFDPMFLINEEGIIQMCNDAASREFGWTVDEMKGENVSMVVGSEHQSKHDGYLKAYLRTGNAKVIGKQSQLVARRKDNSEFAIELGLAEVRGRASGQRLFAGFIHNIEPLKRYAHQIEKRSRLTEGILGASIDPIIQINQQGIILNANKAATDVFGWTEKELVGQNVAILVGSEHARNHDEYIRRYLETGVAKVMGKKRLLKARLKYGGEIDIELSLSEVKTEEGDTRLFCGFIRDVTERVKQEDESLKRERLISGILECSHDPIFVINADGLIQVVNEAAIRMFHYTREEFMGSNISMIVGGSHASRHDQYLKNYIRTGVAHVMGKRRELRARRKDGRETSIELFLSEIETNGFEKRLFVGYIHSISKQKQQEHRIQKRERLLEGIINASLDSMFQIDEFGIIQTCNTTATKVFGWTRDEFIGSNISKIVGGGMGEKHDEYIKRYIRTGEARVMGKKRELMARKKDKGEFPIELSLSEISTNKGEKRLFAGFVRDLSEVKAQRVEISNRETLMKALITACVDPIFSIDVDGYIMMINEAASRAFGYSREELIGHKMNKLCGGDHSKYHDLYLRQYLETGESGVLGQRRILPARHKDGHEFDIELAVVEVLMEDDERYFCGYARLIDDDRYDQSSRTSNTNNSQDQHDGFEEDREWDDDSEKQEQHPN